MIVVRRPGLATLIMYRGGLPQIPKYLELRKPVMLLRHRKLPALIPFDRRQAARPCDSHHVSGWAPSNPQVSRVKKTGDAFAPPQRRCRSTRYYNASEYRSKLSTAALTSVYDLSIILPPNAAALPSFAASSALHLLFPLITSFGTLSFRVCAVDPRRIDL
jgi:hypothetical protein